MKRHIRLIQAVGIAMCIPALILPDSVPPSMITASLVGLAVLAALGAVVVRRPVVRTPVDLPLALLLLITPLNWAISANRALTLPHITKTVAGIAVAYAVAGVLREKRWFRLAAWAICLLGLLMVPIVIFGTNWSGSSKLSWIPYAITKTIPQRFRPFWKPEDYGGFNINLAGGVLAMLLPVPLAYAIFGPDPARKPGAIALAVIARLAATLEVALVGGTLLLTQSRGAILAALVAAGSMLAARNWRWLFLVIVLLVGGLVVLQAGIILPPETLDLESDTASAVNSAEGRLELYSRSLYIMQDFPLTGAGMGMVNEIIHHRYPLFRIVSATRMDHLHNVFLNAGAEQGIPGLVALLSFVLAALAATWHAANRRRVRPPDHPGKQRGPARALCLGALGVIVVFAVHGLTDAITYYLRAHLVAWLLFGVAIGASAPYQPASAKESR